MRDNRGTYTQVQLSHLPLFTYQFTLTIICCKLLFVEHLICKIYTLEKNPTKLSLTQILIIFVKLNSHEMTDFK